MKFFLLTGIAALLQPEKQTVEDLLVQKVANNLSDGEKVTNEIMQTSMFSGIWKDFCKLQLVVSAVPSRRKLITAG